MRQFIIFLCIGSLVMAPAAIAHDQNGTDTNTLLFDSVWPVMGPGGPASDEMADALEAVGLKAARFGSATTASTTHHADATHTLTGFVCTDLDITMSSANPFFHSNLENGIFEATGSFFVDLDLAGADAGLVRQVQFGFAHTAAWPVSSALCTGEFPLPGVYYEFYRGDTNGADGWEIPVNTLLVPDMAYGAVLRALDADGNNLATGFVYANVNNYVNDADWQPGTPTICDQDEITGSILCPYQDVTPPFPSVEGANGHLRTGAAATSCPDGIAFEYGEPLTSFAIVSGTGTVSSYTADGRDVDPLLLTTVSTEVWGDAFCVTNPSSPITVKAVDQSGNIGLFTVN